VLGLGWNEPIVVALIFAPIAFGILKMGRPAAIIALVLCSLGAFANLGVLRASGAAVDGYNNIPRQYRGQYYDPYPAYYYAWFSLAISLACVAAFTNATRGTYAYRQLVSAGRARDKQSAITRAEWEVIKARALAKLRGMKPRMALPVAVVEQNAQAILAPPQKPAPMLVEERQTIVPAMVAPANVVVMPAVPASHARPARADQGFGALIGVGQKTFNWTRSTLFLAANVIAALLYFGRVVIDGCASRCRGILALGGLAGLGYKHGSGGDVPAG
jgi:hypothetical protein